jgi:hypothetical protein
MSPQGSSTQSSYIEAINNGTNTDLKLNESLYLKHNGNVGIGTTNPSAALHIKASSLGQEGLIVENSLGNQTAHIGHLTDGTAYFKLADATGQNHTLLRDNSDSYLNALGGNVGIGTTNPSAKLEINSGTNDASLRLVSTDPYVDIKMSDDTTTDDGVRISNKGDDLLLQRTGGNVGIGTASPGARLTIAQPGTTIGGNDISKGCLLAGSTVEGIGIDNNEIIKKGPLSTSTFVIGNANSEGAIHLKTNLQDRLVIENSGASITGTLTTSSAITINNSNPVLILRDTNGG